MLCMRLSNFLLKRSTCRTSRLSILFTVIRITFEKMRRFLVLSAVALLVAWAVLFAQVFWVCATGDQSWRAQPIPQCDLGLDVAIAQVICKCVTLLVDIYNNVDVFFLGVVVSDAILVFAPIKLVVGVRLPKVTKIRLVSVFASTLVTTAVSLYYIYALLRVGGLTEEYAATIHVCHYPLLMFHTKLIPSHVRTVSVYLSGT